MADLPIATTMPPTIPPRSPYRQPRLFLDTGPLKPTLQYMAVGEAKLHSSCAILSVEELPNPYGSGSSLMPSAVSTCRAIYPPDICGGKGATQISTFEPQLLLRDIGSIDQILQWSQTASIDMTRRATEGEFHDPSSGDKNPLTNLPAQTKQHCDSFWIRMQQKMSFYLLSYGAVDHLRMRDRSIKSMAEKTAAIAAITHCAKYIYRITPRVKRFQPIADKESKDIASVKAWWIDEIPDQCVPQLKPTDDQV